jgi:hypothetical protein
MENSKAGSVVHKNKFEIDKSNYLIGISKSGCIIGIDESDYII